MIKKLAQFLLLLLPVGCAEILWLAGGQPFSPVQIVGIILVSITPLLLASRALSTDFGSGLNGWKRPKSIQSVQSVLRNPLTALLVVSLLGGILFFYLEGGFPDLGAYLLLSIFAALLLLCADLLSGRLPAWVRWIIAGGMALLFGAGVIGALQVIERFSDEEFFAGVQLALLSGWWFLLFAAWRGMFRFDPHALPRRSAQFAALAVILLAVAGGGMVLLRAYQASFYSPQAALYPGITADSPFLCGNLAQPEPVRFYDSAAVFWGLINQAALNPQKTTSDLGMLASTSQDPAWLEPFRQSLLNEARQALYTGPAGSVKFGQYEMALRAYYFENLTRQHPGLFSEEETQEILSWFAAVNRRSLTVEWVDWMYAAAFGEWPKGPYLNQENGASLLSLLEAYGFGDAGLRGQNQAFLRDHNFGWSNHFRNIDDSIHYQTLWINNAIFQSMRNGTVPADQVKKSFEWMLLQAPPDGSPVGYNPDPVTMASSAYLGAQMTGDDRFLWLAGRSLDYLQSHNLPLYAQPGLEKPVQGTSVQPTTGSCLLYGDSGTPVRLGPLAADKIVFRDGWQPSDRYLSLNLRFTGWHRYKAPNAIISLYQGEPLIAELTSAPPSGWLPVGRSVFRDKRIPRENLNGLVIPRSGASKLVYWLTGFGSAWAQDPPFYASVDRFTTGPEMDQSVTSLNWNGWKQTRSITFVHDGPTVVIDEASGPGNQRAGIAWHALVPQGFENTMIANQNSYLLGSKGAVEMRLLRFEGGHLTSNAEKNGGQAGMNVLYTGSRGTIKLVTLFLSGEWRGADLKFSGGSLLIQIPGRSVEIPLPSGFIG